MVSVSRRRPTFLRGMSMGERAMLSVGYLILQAEGAFDINTVMAGILVLTAFALVLDAAVGKIEKRLMKWQPRSGETEKL